MADWNKPISLQLKNLGFPENHKFQSLVNIMKASEEFVLDQYGLITASNLETVNITGYEEAEVIGKHISFLYTEEDQLNGKPEVDLNKAFKLGNQISTGFRVKKRGAKFWAKMKFIKVKDEDFIGYKVILQDATHRAMYHWNSRRIKDEYLSLFNNSFIGMFKFSIKDYSLLMINTKALSIIGKQRDDLNFKDLFYFEKDFRMFIRKINIEKAIENFEFRVNSQRLTYCSISSKLFINGGFIEGVISDITDQKQQVIELQKLNNELDNFLYHASHDLRSPISTILGLTNLIQADNSLEHIKEYGTKISSSIIHMDSLLKDLSHVAYNNSQNIKPELFNPGQTITDIVIPYTKNYPSVKLTLQIESKKPFRSDLLRIRTILSNIISNAFKYAINPNPTVSIRFELKNETGFFLIEDNGVGISKENLKNISKLFFKIDSRGKGSGLGLYVVQIMLEKIGGKISIRSTPGKGTRVALEIPDILNHE